MLERAILNRIWSRVLLEELVRFGIENVCVAPGSRSTPLILEADCHPSLTLHSHFDERGLGFLALGLAKASRKPVAIIVTSGTAVANLLPAIAESRLTGEQLVVLTADRPVDLIDCGANQAIYQPDIFARHVTRSVPLPSPSESIPLSWLLATVDQAMFEQQRLGGTIHINCPYPEPLYVQGGTEVNSPYVQTVQSWLDSNQTFTSQPVNTQVAEIYPDDWCHRKGVIVVGSVTLNDAKAVEALASRLGWPLLCDPQSGIASDWNGFDIWMQHPQALAALSASDCIIVCGSRIVSKRLNQWLASHVNQTQCPFLYISPSLHCDNQHHLSQAHYVMDIDLWCQQVLEHLPDSPVDSFGWGNDLISRAEQVPVIARQSTAGDGSLSELLLALNLPEWSSGHDLFIGNSLIVRLTDMFSRIGRQNVYTNRGASGIDGLVASAAGVQRATQRPLCLLIGDTSLLHDLNSLALLRHSEPPVVVIVTNNDGGAIFDLLPVPQSDKRSLYQVPHGLNFEFAARQFGLAYANPTRYDDFCLRVKRHLSEGQGALVIEVTSCNQLAADEIRNVVKQIHAQ